MDVGQALRALAEASADDVGRLLLHASRAVTGAVLVELHARGYDDVRPSHAAVVAQLDEDGTRMAELARRTGTTRQAVAASVRDLVAGGYVTTAADPADARASVVRLTARGADLCHAAAGVLRQGTTTWGQALDDDGLTHLRTQLARLAAAADAPQVRGA